MNFILFESTQVESLPPNWIFFYLSRISSEVTHRHTHTHTIYKHSLYIYIKLEACIQCVPTNLLFARLKHVFLKLKNDCSYEKVGFVLRNKEIV